VVTPNPLGKKRRSNRNPMRTLIRDNHKGISKKNRGPTKTVNPQGYPRPDGPKRKSPNEILGNFTIHKRDREPEINCEKRGRIGNLH